MYAERVAEAYRKEENLLNAAFTYKRALESYPSRALHYLEQAEKLELAMNPEAARFYLLERGKLQKDLSLLTQATELFINPWERENLEDALVHRARLLSEKLKITRLLPPFLTPSGWSTEALEQDLKKTILQIQEINPGALGQQGLKVPTSP
jgi:tetratricopeptide (TPR) repeat protein